MPGSLACSDPVWRREREIQTMLEPGGSTPIPEPSGSPRRRRSAAVQADWPRSSPPWIRPSNRIEYVTSQSYYGHMKKASVTEAKNNLSALLDSVKGGSPIL